MPALTGWEGLVVSQKRPATGCIPTGYQVILRAASVSIDEVSFQDDFDLDKDLSPDELRDAKKRKNNFHSVRDAIRNKYPDVSFEIHSFDLGEDELKIKFIEQQLAAGIPTLVSIPVNTNGTEWAAHIFLAVGSDADSVLLFDYLHPTQGPQTRLYTKQELRRLHRMFPGEANEVAFLPLNR